MQTRPREGGDIVLQEYRLCRFTRILCKLALFVDFLEKIENPDFPPSLLMDDFAAGSPGRLGHARFFYNKDQPKNFGRDKIGRRWLFHRAESGYWKRPKEPNM